MKYKDWKEMMQSEDGEFFRLSDEEKEAQYTSFLFRKVERYEKALKEISEETGTPYAEIAIKALKDNA